VCCLLFTESSASVNASLYIIQSLCNSDISVKLEAVRQVIASHWALLQVLLLLFIDYAEAASKHTDMQNMIKAVNIKRQH